MVAALDIENRSASDYFDCIRGIAAQKRNALRRLESIRARESVRAQRYGEIYGKGGYGDPTAAVAGRMDAETMTLKEIERMDAAISEAYDILADVRAANKHHNWADVIELRYIEGLDWKSVARVLDISASGAQHGKKIAFEWMDANGYIP